jgi:uncharacterized phage infection (PIP) family protein YhgE
MTESKDNALIDLGGTPPSENVPSDLPTAVVTPELATKVKDILSQFTTHREILEHQTFELADCVAIATEIYKSFPTTDNAYQLSSLANTYKSSLSQLDKMADPISQLDSLSTIIHRGLLDITKALAEEIRKTKRELQRISPQESTTIEDCFSRMLDAMTPATDQVLKNMQSNICKALGIKTKE